MTPQAVEDVIRTSEEGMFFGGLKQAVTDAQVSYKKKCRKYLSKLFNHKVQRLNLGEYCDLSIFKPMAVVDAIGWMNDKRKTVDQINPNLIGFMKLN